tara:strand:+ start:2006 stop:2263 length:258 start_codon:yes stop_codon:yes gene_type:complete
MRIEIEFNRESNSHVAYGCIEGETRTKVAEIFGWIQGGTPSIKVPYYLPVDALKEIENVIQREGQGGKTGMVVIDTGDEQGKQEA